MNNLSNIKNLEPIYIQVELYQIIKYFLNNNFNCSYVKDFINTCDRLLQNGKNKTININDVNEFEKAILIEFESYLNIKNMNRG